MALRIGAPIGAIGVTAACISGDPAAPSRRVSADRNSSSSVRDFAGGSRLRARYYEVDRTAVLRDFFDTQRGEPCAFVDDGVVLHAGPGSTGRLTYWCLPHQLARHDREIGPFGDETCTTPVAIAPAVGGANVAISIPVDSCASAPFIHRVGPPKMMQPWILDDQGSCLQVTASLPIHALGEEIPLDAFVSAEERVEDRGGSRIASLVLAAADGARQTIGGFDHQRNEPVRFEDTGDAPAQWLPLRVAFQGAGQVLYRDNACTLPIPTKTTREAVCPLTAVRVFRDQCGHVDIFEIGPPLDPQNIHDLTATSPTKTTCTNRPELAKRIFAFDIGNRVLPTALAPGFVIESGGDLVRRRGFLGPGGSGSGSSTIASWGDLVDVSTNEACAPAIAIDGALRCLPIASASVTLFSDEECIAPAFAQPLTGCERGQPHFVRASLSGDATSGAQEQGARVFEIVGEAPVLFELRNEQCTTFTPVVPSHGYALKEIDVARFSKALEVDGVGL